MGAKNAGWITASFGTGFGEVIMYRIQVLEPTGEWRDFISSSNPQSVMDSFVELLARPDVQPSKLRIVGSIEAGMQTT